MSIQLILHPQSYGGQFNTISSSPTEVIVNGISFTNLNTSGTYTSTSGTPYIDTVTSAPPTVYNAWYRYRVGASAYPTVTLADVVLNSLGNGSSEPTGIYQKITNLVVGQQYKVVINIGTQAANGSLANRFFDGLVPQGSVTTFSTATTSISKIFTATNTEMTYMMAYYSTAAEDLTISNISVQPLIGAIPSGDTSILDNGQVIVDLYEDEDLPLTLSVDDFKNVAEKVQSYSKAFNLPATKRNNRIFDQVFEVTRHLAGGSPLFNPYRKTKCVLKQDGFTLFEGYLRMLDITDKNGEISYNVNLYSEVIALADFLKDLDFRALDFSELEHDYNKIQITASWNDSPSSGITYLNPSTSGFRDANSTVKYPFVDWNKQWFLGGSNGGNSATIGNPELPSLETAFRPFINIKYIIDRIFEATPFTYSSDFFDTDDFKKLYMDFNWGSDNTPFSIDNSGEGGLDADQTATTSYATILTNDNNFATNIGYSSGVYTALSNSQTYNINYSYAYSTVASGAWSAEYRWKLVLGGVTSYINTTPMSGLGSYTLNVTSGSFTQILNLGDTLTPEFKSDTAATTTFKFLDFQGGFQSGLTLITTSASAFTTDTFLQTLRGETGQWDFLKGLITMFNLVTIPDENNPNNIVIEPYVNVFMPTPTATVPLTGTTLADRGVIHNWTEKIDVSEMKLEPLTDLNKKTMFKFVEDDDDFSFNNYKNLVGGHLYGSKKFDATNEFNILDGEDEIVAEPFAATVVKPLMSQFPQFITPAIYSYNPSDETSEGFDNSPRIMYNNGIKSTGASYYIPAQNGVTSANETNFLQFSHLSEVPTTSTSIDFNFGWNQLLPGVGAGTLNNLFNLYWLPYYSELYNINTRTMTIKVNLTPADINTFKFNDRVMIKNRVFRCNKIDYKPNDLATVEFILIP